MPPVFVGSPDGRYVAALTVGEAEVGHLWISERRRPAARTWMAHLEGVEGFRWLPRRPHMLIAATCATGGVGSLVLWKGGRHVRPLVRVRRPDDECFVLVGVSRDGRWICYNHAVESDAPDVPFRQFEAQLKLSHWVQAPER